MTDIVHIKVEGIEDELILSAMQVLNQTFYENSVMNQSATPELVFKFTENQSGNQLLVTGCLLTFITTTNWTGSTLGVTKWDATNQAYSWNEKTRLS